jgi:hypothetical protein
MEFAQSAPMALQAITAALLNDTLTDVKHGGHLILISSINRS